ncbi:MAG: NADPH-dependent FMN reductase [Bacteroidota bacterium]
MLTLKIIIASTRTGRKGPSIASWIVEAAAKHPGFKVELIDLAEVNLPFLDEPNHPRLMKYEHGHTKAWSAAVSSADAFVIVTPEYNYGFPASLKNALDFVYNEWSYKPVAFVSYGGLAAGTRAVQMLKLVVTTLKMMPMVESVNIPFFTKFIDEHGTFKATEELEKSADAMLKELLFWAEGLKAMRASR